MNKGKQGIFIIRHKETKDVWVAPSGKSSWRAANHAKSAWVTGQNWRSPDRFFKCQDEYEIINLYNYGNLEEAYSELSRKYEELKFRMEGLEK